MATKIPPSAAGVPAGQRSSALGSPATDLSISTGLAGDTDGGYEIEGTIVTPGNVAAATFTLQLNGADPANVWSNGVLLNGGTAPANLTATQNLVIGNSQVLNLVYVMTFHIVIGSKSGEWQNYKCTSESQRTASPSGPANVTNFIGGQFKTASQITAVSIHSSVTGAIDTTSFFKIRPRNFTS